MPKVFICHSSSDHDFVSQLAEDLKKNSINVWYDEWEIKVGDNIIEKINQGLKESDYLVVVLSKSSSKSKWFIEELSAARTMEIDNKGIFILPVLIEKCTIPPLIASKRYADFRKSYDSGLKDLLNVFNITFAVSESEKERYLTLENQWITLIEEIEKGISNISKLVPDENNKKKFWTTNAFNDENIQELRSKILKSLDIYRALRSIEKSERLLKSLDSSAYVLSIFGRAHDIQIEILEKIFSNSKMRNINNFLQIGMTQAVCDMKDEAIWSFRKAMRIALYFEKDNWADTIATLTYKLGRFIAYHNFDEEYDIAIHLFVCKDHEYEKSRINKTIECWRLAFEKEIPCNLNKDFDAMIMYADIMFHVGFWRESMMYFEKSKNFIRDDEIKQHYQKIKKEREKERKSKNGTYSISFTFHQMGPYSWETGVYFRTDELLKQYEPEFWKSVVEGLDISVDSEFISAIFPDE